MPAAPKPKAYAGIVATQSDDAKYRQKYKELKTKVLEIEEDNNKLSVKILKSKKAIQRLRIERAILYDRLQSTVAPTNPYALSSALHLASLASSSTASTSSDPNAPPSILAPPSYPLADPAAPDLFLRQLDAQKLAALEQPPAGGSTHVEYGERPIDGIAGEQAAAREHRALMAAGGPVNGQAAHGNGVQAAVQAAGASGAGAAAPEAAVPQAVEPAQAEQMQVDKA
ncbi:hypothetical protein JCM3775_001427 [Rhodotorula graminis]|uniref:INO80 complex subunit F domain-containing protein n=1 Tax=Rhodotorula graminis (strain WP1) TaxID=578459 RepID=A0A194S760_RHOGW|nr:uncharacterized protein RHOBADRAFT_52399 [Rhodotorula graminis WP1]KPV76384.1 hypothetical protein RHOBADRAFT_52399 [Rhodotorula graminis WP1]